MTVGQSSKPLTTNPHKSTDRGVTLGQKFEAVQVLFHTCCLLTVTQIS